MLSNPGEAHLVLGLGGLGISVVQRVPPLLERHPRQTAPVVFAGIDSCLEPPATPSSLETFWLPLRGAAASLKQPDHPWLPAGLPLEPTAAGTRGIRALGRLAYTLNVRYLEEWLSSKLDALVDPQRPAQVEVSLVAALGGGTGGAILADLAYSLQRLLTGGIPHTIRALILVRPKGRVDERASANLYAALTELNHFLAPDTSYSFQYGSGQAWETVRPPVDRVYFFTCSDPEDAMELESTVGQLAFHLGMRQWPEYSVLRQEVRKRQEVLFREGDQRGNPACFYADGSAALLLPFEEIGWTLASRLARLVVARWRSLLFRVESSSATRPSDQSIGERFLTAQRLSLKAVLESLEAPLADEHGVPFRPAERVEQTRRVLLKAAAPAPVLADLDQQMLEQTGPDGSWGVARRLGERALEVLRVGQAEIDRELSSYFTPGEEDFTGFCRLLEDLTAILSLNLQNLYERLNLREVESMKLAESKASLEKGLPAERAGGLRRLLGRAELAASVEEFLATAERLYDNRLSIMVQRAALDVFLGLLRTVEQFSAGVRELQVYLQELEADLAGEEVRAFRRIFSIPGEVLLQGGEVEAFLESQSTPGAVAQASLTIVNAMDLDLFELPRAVDKQTAQTRMLFALTESLDKSGQADVVEQFMARYPGDIARDQLRILFERARPGLAVSAEVPGYQSSVPASAIYAGVPGGMDPEGPDKQQLLERLKVVAEGMTILPLLSRERLVIVRVLGGVPLRAFDFNEAQRAYLQELRLGRFPMHSRRDLRWRAPSRPTPTEQQQLYSRVAVALHLGHLEVGAPTKAMPAWPNPRGAGDGPYGVDQLTSPRWPDMGAVKRCLEVYANFHEALWVEQNLLAALIRWQDERLDELGAESYLKSLVHPGPPLELLGMSLDVDLGRARQLLLAQMEQSWERWDGLVQRALARSPILSEGDLISLPKGYRKWAMQRYLEAHPEENLAYHPSSARLELVSARDLAAFEAIWRRLVDSLEDDPALFADHAGDLIRLLCHNLGFRPQESLGFGPLRGMKVETHGLRVKIPRVIPVLVSQKTVLSGDEIDSLRSLLEQVGQTTRFGLLIVADEVERNAQLVDEQLRSLLRYDVIVLGPRDLRDILRVRHRLSALVGKILEQVDLTVVSPFITEGPVAASMFFGREGEIKEILYRLERGSVALLGPRRIGKTSIVQRVLASQRAAGQPLIYLDCQALSTAHDLLVMLASEYLNQNLYDSEEPASALRRMLADLRLMYNGRKLYLVLDEVDLLLAQPESAVLMRVFRSAAADGTAEFLLCGERTLQRKLSEADSPLSNFCHAIRVHFLPARDAAKLITEPLEQMELKWEDRAAGLDRIIDFTGGHPNLIQRVCSALVERLNEERGRVIRAAMIEEVLLGPQLEDYLETLWGSSTYLEKIVTLVIEPGESVTAQEIKRRLEEQYEVEGSLSNVVEALEDLCLFGLLERQGTRHAFRMESFPYMVRAAMDVSEAVELYKELMLYGS